MPVNIIDTLKPKNGLNFPVVEAIDVFVEDYENLADAISHFATDAMIEAINKVLSGKANTSDVNTSVANLQGQINQIVISATAESIVAPEVAAARVDSGGFEHTTLKERNDYTDHVAGNISSDIDAVATIIKNLYNNDTVESGFISTSGTYTPSNDYKVTDYIPVDSRDTLILEVGRTKSTAYMRFITAYDTAKNVISTMGDESTKSYPVPYGVAYVRISFVATYYDANNTNELMILTNGEVSQTYIDDKSATINIDAIPSELFESIDAIADDVSTQQDEITIIQDAAVEVVTDEDTVNILDEVSTNDGFMSVDGTIYTSSQYASYMYTDQFDVLEGDVVTPYASRLLRCVVAFVGDTVDSSKGAQNVTTYTVPSGVKKLVCTTEKSALVINKTHYTVSYRNSMEQPVNEIASTIEDLPPSNIIGITRTGYNYVDDTIDIKEGYYVYGSIGKTVMYYKNNTYDSVIIPILPGEYVISGTAARFAIVSDLNNKIISIDETFDLSKTVEVPDTITSGYLFLTINHDKFTSLKVAKKGTSAETEYTVEDKWVFEKGISQKVHAHLPKYVYVAVGRTIELYNNQVCLEADKFHVQWNCNVGYALKRKFSITGETQIIGDYSLTCNIYDDSKSLLWSGETTLKIVDNSISDSYTCVAIGDSLTNNKRWTPEVINLSSGAISFVGHYSASNYDSDGTSRSFRHDGRSGYSTGSYLSGAPYTFGGGDEPEHNVFWNPTSERFDWNYYKTNVNVDPDFVQIFLGTNELNNDNSGSVANFRQMVDYIRQDDANIPIYLINTIYFGTQDGIGKQRASDGYSANFKGYWKYNQDLKVMDLMTRLDAEFENDTNVFMINLAVSHDSEYNFGAVETPVNPRATQTELMPTEGVHPQAQGYFQMADVLYSAYVATLE